MVRSVEWENCFSAIDRVSRGLISSRHDPNRFHSTEPNQNFLLSATSEIVPSNPLDVIKDIGLWPSAELHGGFYVDIEIQEDKKKKACLSILTQLRKLCLLLLCVEPWRKTAACCSQLDRRDWDASWRWRDFLALVNVIKKVWCREKGAYGCILFVGARSFLDRWRYEDVSYSLRCPHTDAIILHFF